MLNSRETPWKDAISFRVSHEYRPGVLGRIVEQVGLRQPMLAGYVRHREHHAEFIAAIEDFTYEQGFSAILELCRELQQLNYCNNVRAEFAKFGGVLHHSASGMPVIALSPLRSVLFESSLSRKLIGRAEPIHPENSDESVLRPVTVELDRVVADFIKDPERLFKVSPSELELIVAEVYRSHGFDVRVTGGPRDHGVDAVAIAEVPISLPRKFAHTLRIGIQAKRYRRENKVSERELRDFFGTVIADDFDRGVLVTTSSLTAAATEYLDVRRAVRDRITVVAGEDVIELLVSYCKQRWIPFWR